MQSYTYILIAIGIGNLLTMIIGGYVFLQKPSVAAKQKAEDAADELEKQKTACDYKHRRIDELFEEVKETIKSIQNSLLLLKENDIKHIEQEQRRMSDVQTKILTILEYREKEKK